MLDNGLNAKRVEAMILYHFTYPEFVDSIMRDGLIPSDGSASAGGQSELTGPTLVGHACVFLTERPTLVPSWDHRVEMLTQYLCLVGPYASNLPEARVCLSMKISTTDKRLVKHKDFYWKKFGDTGFKLIESSSDWLYFGTIPPGIIRHHHTRPHNLLPYWHLDISDFPQRQPGQRYDWPPELVADLLNAKKGPDDYIKAHSEPFQPPPDTPRRHERGRAA
jgi:hypothetical protein